MIAKCITMMAVGLLMAAATGFGAESYGPYRADVIRVTDGDTVKVAVHIAPGHIWTVGVRVDGVDTPETMRPACAQERVAGRAATEFVREWLMGRAIVVDGVREDKYGGRVIGSILRGSESLADALIANGHARPYHGGKRTGWCG